VNFARKLAVAAALSLPLYAVVGVGVANAEAVHVVADDGQALATERNATDVAPATIQAGVNAATAGDTVKVCPGTYVENVSITKQLTLLGAQAGVDARTRSGTENETVVDPDDVAALTTMDILPAASPSTGST